MFTGVKPVTQAAACVKVDHDVSVGASAEQLKAISDGSRRLTTSRRGHRQHFQQRSMENSLSGMQRPRSEQHNVRQPLREREHQKLARRPWTIKPRLKPSFRMSSATVPEEYRPEVQTDDVSMAIEVTSAERNDGHSSGSRSAEREEENRR